MRPPNETVQGDIDTVIFDLGGVLIDWDPRHPYRKLFDDEATMERFLAEICSPDWNHQMDGGLPFEHGVAELVKRHPDQADFIEAFWKRWPEMLNGAIQGTVDILEALHEKGLPLYALSNWSAQTWPHALDRFAFLDRFEGLVISGFEGTMKPRIDIFEILRDRYHIVPRKAVFIDDRAENVAAAERLGFRGIRFQNSAKLSEDLRGLGLL